MCPVHQMIRIFDSGVQMLTTVWLKKIADFLNAEKIVNVNIEPGLVFKQGLKLK